MKDNHGCIFPFWKNTYKLLIIFTLLLPMFNAKTVFAMGETCGAKPVDLMLVLDRSGSVSDSERQGEEDAAKALLDLFATSDNGSRVGIVRFAKNDCGQADINGIAELVSGLAVVSPGTVGGLKTTVGNALNMASCQGTNGESAINVAQGELAANAINKPVIVFLSDGDFTRSSGPLSHVNDAKAAATAAKNAGTKIITIAFDASGFGDVGFRQNLAQMASFGFDNTVGGVSDAERIAENNDGDDFFIGLTGPELTEVFILINQILQCDDDGNPCTVEFCNKDTNVCDQELIPNCVPCEYDGDCQDGNVCNGKETCDLAAGTCIGGKDMNCDDGNVCTEDRCDEVEGCQHLDIPNCIPCLHDGECNDGNVCTDDKCDLNTGTCKYTNNTDPCDDGLFCNGKDTCSGGLCKYHEGDPCEGGVECSNRCDEDRNNCIVPDQTPCTDDGNECTDNVCIEGTCKPVNNQDQCNDGDKCSTGDQCSGGECSGSQVNCDDGIECTTDKCDDNTGGCIHDPSGCECINDGDCDDGNVCTDEYCDLETYTCKRTNNEKSCDDGLFCNGEDVCYKGECVSAGDPCTEGGECADKCNEEKNTCNDPQGVECTDDGNICTDNVCNGHGDCVPVNNNDDCNDGNDCTLDDQCSGGECVPGADKDCNDGVACTTDICIPETGKCENSTKGCECTKDDDCDDGNVCTDEYCDLETFTCERTNNNNTCDDGLFCNGEDICSNGECVSQGNPCAEGAECADKCDEENNTCNDPAGVECTDDGNVCTDNVCDGNGACVPVNNEADCNDGDECTLNDQCSGGECMPGAPKECSDGVECTTDTCNSETGECQNDTMGCQCTNDEDCNDDNVCTDEFCNLETLTCQRTNNNNPCSDGFFCNGDEVCSEGQCVSSGNPCTVGGECADVCDEENDTCNDPVGTLCTDDENPCTDNQCDGNGACVPVSNSNDCDDNNPCTLNDVCDEGSCQSGTLKDCSDALECSVDFCDAVTGACVNDTSACEEPPLGFVDGEERILEGSGPISSCSLSTASNIYMTNWLWLLILTGLYIKLRRKG